MKKSGLKRHKPLQPKGRPGKKTKKPGSNRGDQRAQARLAKQQRYREICLLVDERDKGKCQAPNCNKRGTQHHHIRYKSEGGADDLENLVLLCGEHHTGDQSPHNRKEWRDYWRAWQRAKYPEYAALIRPYEAPIDPKELQDIGEWSEELADFTI